MLYCGIIWNGWVETALNYLPTDVFDQINGKIAFTVLNYDAFRLAHKIRDHEEIIVLSPWIFSYIPACSCETDKEYKYFIFCVLHEVAHAVLKHYPPDEISNEENNEQEKQADNQALSWYNTYVLENSEKGYTTLTIDEIRMTQETYQKKLKSILT